MWELHGCVGVGCEGCGLCGMRAGVWLLRRSAGTSAMTQSARRSLAVSVSVMPVLLTPRENEGRQWYLKTGPLLVVLLGGVLGQPGRWF